MQQYEYCYVVLSTRITGILKISICYNKLVYLIKHFLIILKTRQSLFIQGYRGLDDNSQKFTIQFNN